MWVLHDSGCEGLRTPGYSWSGRCEGVGVVELSGSRREGVRGEARRRGFSEGFTGAVGVRGWGVVE